jgi:predicted flap endonuclease-1-like 5' DNA nuclease
MEGSVAWFVGRSLLVIVVSFVLGLLIGWLWWRRRKVQFGESHAVRTVTQRHESVVAEKDAELARLRALVDRPRPVAAPVAAAATPIVEPELPPEQERGAVEPEGLSDSDEHQGAQISQTAAGVGGAARGVAGAAGRAGGKAAGVVAAGAGTVGSVAESASEAASNVASDVASDVKGATRAPARAVVAQPAVAQPAVTQPAVAQPAAAQADDELERIEGIGPRIASALRAADIRSFERLASSPPEALQRALEAAGLRFAPSLPTWARQARFLAAGDEAGFTKLTEQLVAGRDTSEKA